MKVKVFYTSFLTQAAFCLIYFLYALRYRVKHSKQSEFRSSRSQKFFKIVFRKTSQYSQETPVLESLFNKVPGLKACILIKKRLQHRCFPLNFAKF